MLNVTMEFSANRLQLTADGHAGYARMGQDIVCAAASSLMSTLMLALNAQLGRESDIYFDDPRDGPLTIDCGPSEDDMPGAKMIFRTIACGIEALSFKYPDNVRFELRETEPLEIE